jgi:hypothetical protein
MNQLTINPVYHKKSTSHPHVAHEPVRAHDQQLDALAATQAIQLQQLLLTHL